MHENIIVEQKMAAPAAKVWKALTDKNQMKEWYFDIPDFELGLHQEFNFYEPGENKKFHHHAEILEIIPNSKLKHTWSYPEFSKDKTIVKWELEDEGDSTLVRLTHKGLENLEHLGKDFRRESFEAGWHEIVGQLLKDYVEK